MFKNFDLVINTAYLTEDELCDLLRKLRAIYALEQIDQIIENATEKMAEAIAKNRSVNAEILKKLHKKYPNNKDIVVDIIFCKEISSDLLHEVFTNRKTLFCSSYTYVGFASNPKACEEDLEKTYYAALDFESSVKEKVYINLASNGRTGKDTLKLLLKVAQENKNYDLLVAVLKNHKMKGIEL